MHSGPSRIAEAIVAMFVPPACREEVVGDLHERYESSSQYAADALATVPLVILSRIWRTADPQVLLMHAFAIYLSFSGAVWFSDGHLSAEKWDLLRLAIPTVMVLIGLILDDTYAKPGRRVALDFVKGPMLGVVLVMASQGILWMNQSALALPRWTAIYGCGASLLLSSAIRLLFPPVTGQLQGVNAPVGWLKRAGSSDGKSWGFIRILQVIAVLLALAAIGTWMAERSFTPKPRHILILLATAFAYGISKRRR